MEKRKHRFWTGFVKQIFVMSTSLDALPQRRSSTSIWSRIQCSKGPCILIFFNMVITSSIMPLWAKHSILNISEQAYQMCFLGQVPCLIYLACLVANIQQILSKWMNIPSSSLLQPWALVPFPLARPSLRNSWSHWSSELTSNTFVRLGNKSLQQSYGTGMKSLLSLSL